MGGVRACGQPPAFGPCFHRCQILLVAGPGPGCRREELVPGARTRCRSLRIGRPDPVRRRVNASVSRNIRFLTFSGFKCSTAKTLALAFAIVVVVPYERYLPPPMWTIVHVGANIRWVCGVRCAVCGVRSAVCGRPGAQVCPVPRSARCQAPAVRCQVSVCPVSGTFEVCPAQRLSSSAVCLPSASRQSPPPSTRPAASLTFASTASSKRSALPGKWGLTVCRSRGTPWDTRWVATFSMAETMFSLSA